MPQPNPVDILARNLAEWVIAESAQIAEAVKGGLAAPGAANISEKDKLDYYTRQFFNPDGAPNIEGRNKEAARMGTAKFAETFKEVTHAHPELLKDNSLELFQQGPQAHPPALQPVATPELPAAPPLPPGPVIPAFAEGGIVTQPTVALVGEAGPEAIVPLNPDSQGQTAYDLLAQQQAAHQALAMSELRQGERGEYPTPTPRGADPAASADQIAAYIRQAAASRGIDPDVAMAVALHEGFGTGQPAQEARFSTGRSWWPFQLHYGGAGTPYAAWGGTAGLGNEFTAATGWQPGDPRAWQDSIDFALDTALRRGWFPTWYGSVPAGVGPRQGLPTRSA